MSFHTMSARVQALGGNQLERINKQKLQSLKWALKNDGNARLIETPVMGAKWALITQDTASGLHSDYDNKYIDIPFDAELHTGDTFRILDDDSHWMIYLPIVTETAYLRAQIRLCRYSFEIDGTEYWIYFQGPTETDIRWNLKRNTSFNEPNFSGTIYIKNNEQTRNYFHRFTTFMINGKTWQVQVVDEISVDGILELEVQEYYNNSVARLPKIVKNDDVTGNIHGQNIVKQDSVNGYSIVPTAYSPDKEWKVTGNPRVKLDEVFDGGRSCNVRVAPGAIKTFLVSYGEDSLKVGINWRKPVIQGPQEVYPYDIHTYWLKGIDDGTEVMFRTDVPENVAKFKEVGNDYCKIEFRTGKSTNLILYAKNGDDTYELPIIVKSL